jgi:hypothetical protein
LTGAIGRLLKLSSVQQNITLSYNKQYQLKHRNPKTSSNIRMESLKYIKQIHVCGADRAIICLELVYSTRTTSCAREAIQVEGFHFCRRFLAIIAFKPGVSPSDNAQNNPPNWIHIGAWKAHRLGRV